MTRVEKSYRDHATAFHTFVIENYLKYTSPKGNTRYLERGNMSSESYSLNQLYAKFTKL